MSSTYGFELLGERFVSELNTTARLFRHTRTGAQLLSLENNDENKVFGITFRTPPDDSTGLPHIMEHAVLCGSQKYPLKEPFKELARGSLNTFLNAFTYPDKTCYPVASQNLQDFYNLIDVYMDAVLHPLIPPHTLQQEGWHYELEGIDAPLTYKGVVFNEMKGAYSNPDDLLEDRARMSLFPSTPYVLDSGGDPRRIPDLTYSQFKAFHERYYHPSNARIFIYGDDDPQERLRRMDAYLQGYNALKIDSAIPLQEPFDQPRRLVVPFDPGDDPANRKGRMVVNWLLAESGEAVTMLGLSILAHILLGTPASPLRKALIDSGLGEDLAGGGLEGQLRQSYFSTGLRGMTVRDDFSLAEGERLEKLIFDTLRSLAQDGIDPDTIAASMNTIEFRLRENNTGSFPRGLVLMLRSLTTWLYDGDPITALAYEAPLTAIKSRLSASEPYFENLIQRYLLENTHRTTVILQPDPGLTQREEAAEVERLAKIKAGLDRAGLENILAEARQLKELQDAPDSVEALATIPSLKLDDLDRHNKLIPLTLSAQDDTQILYHDLFTNGIVYLDLLFDLRVLPQKLLPYVPLLGRSLIEVGTKTQDFVKLSQRIGTYTGGIRPTTLVSPVRGASDATAWLVLRGKATMAQSDYLLDILRDILLTVQLDNRERFRQMVLEEKAGKEAMLVPAGHRIVNSRLRAHFNEADWLEEQMHGVESLFFTRSLAQAIEEDWPSVLEKLEALRQVLFDRSRMMCNVTLDATNWLAFQPRLAAFLSALPAYQSPRLQWTPSPVVPYEALTIPAQVNYVAKGADLYRLGYQAHGSISVIANYLNNAWLWEKVRVQGGAYGGFCTFSHRSGVLTFLSYRDPNLLSTLENYDGAAGFLRDLDLSQDELHKTIIGAIGDMDAYQLPDAKGYTSLARYLAGDTDETRQLWRDQVLSTTVDDFRSFAQILDAVNQDGQVAVLGPAEAIAKANAERDGWLKVVKVL